MLNDLSFECNLPKSNYNVITLGHGGGGKLTEDLLDHIFRPAFDNKYLNQQHDSTLIQLNTNEIAITTDSYVVHPLFFPGGNIGELAVIGSINDLAMRGAEPKYLTCGFILTEGLEISTLIQVVDHMRRAAMDNQVQIVAGDIKVIEKQTMPSIFINTTGIGVFKRNTNISPAAIQDQDAIIISHDIGRHGLAVLSAREKMDFNPPIESDCRALWPLVEYLLNEGIELHCLRDLTRGGLAGALIEIAKTCQMCIECKEENIPVLPNVQAGCEILGLDPLYVANEGCMIMFLPQSQVDGCIQLLVESMGLKNTKCIGQVNKSLSDSAFVQLNTAYGTKRKLNLFSGEQLPRIC